LVTTLEHASASVGGLPEGTSVHLDRGYDSDLTRERLEERGLLAERSLKRESQPHFRQREALGSGEDELLALAKLAHKKLL